MCLCVCVVMCEIMRLLAQRAGTLGPREVVGWKEKETNEMEEGEEMNHNHIKLQKGQSNINRVRRLNWQFSKIKKQKKKKKK